MNEYNHLKVLIVGLGSIGMRHAQNFSTLGIDNLIGVDPDPSRHQNFLEKLGGKAYENLKEALKEKPDLSVIASPNRYHVEQAQSCADADSHLFIEKPLGISLDDIENLIKTVKSKNLFSHVGSNWKFHNSFKTIKTLLEENAIGQITSAQVLAGQWLPDWHPWEDYRNGYSARKDLGGGTVFDSHDFDYINWLLGPVIEIKGMIAHSGVLEIETEDVACACLKTASGALITIQVDYIQRHPMRRYHITGTEGTIIWELGDENVKLYTVGQPTPKIIDAPLGEVNDMYLDQIQHILDGIENTDERRLPITSIEAASEVTNLQLKLLSQT